MPRPRHCRRIHHKSRIALFKPQGIPAPHLEHVELTAEELEALRLKDYEGLLQEECAKRMHTSQSTFQRILSSARKKASTALIKGKAIRIIK